MPPSNSETAAAPSHNHAGFMNGNGVEFAVKTMIPGPPNVPKTLSNPWVMNTAAMTSRKGSGAHEAVVAIIFLNIK